MPVLGLGAWRLVGVACARIVSKALELGYRHIDTAELYGNEAEIGRAIRSVERAGLFLTSKVGSANLRTNDVIRACTNSLERLGTDYLDLYLVHWPNDEIPIEETMDGMQYLVEEGMIRSIGVSNFDVGRLQAAMDAAEAPVCNDQVEYHPYRPRRELPQFCREQGIALTAYCPLGKGRVLRDPTLARIGQKYGKSAAQVSLRWLLQKGAIVIPKAGSIEHLQENTDMDQPFCRPYLFSPPGGWAAAVPSGERIGSNKIWRETRPSEVVALQNDSEFVFALGGIGRLCRHI